MTRDRAFALTLLIGGCFLATFLIGIAYGPSTAPTAAPTQIPTITRVPPTPAIYEGTQTTVLLLGVNSQQALHPTLEMCWALTFLAGTQEYFLVGFSPDLVVQLPGDVRPHTLAEVFNSDAATAQGHRLMQSAVKTISPALTVQAEVDFDRAQLLAGIGQLETVQVDGQSLDRDQVDAYWAQLRSGGSNTRLEWEGELLKAIIQRDWNTPQARPLFSLGEWLYPSPDWFMALAAQYAIAPDAEIYVTTYPGSTP